MTQLCGAFGYAIFGFCILCSTDLAKFVYHIFGPHKKKLFLYCDLISNKLHLFLFTLIPAAMHLDYLI